MRALTSLLAAHLFCACAAQTPRVDHGASDNPDTFMRQGFAGAAAVILPRGDERCYGECEMRFSPASSFKVPHALIALNAGVLSGPEHVFSWDGEERSVPAWNQDHTLASAIENSVVWYFQRVAPRIGRERFEDELPRFGYGDANIGEDLTRFWLDDSLTVSPMEQARFWRRLHAGELPVTDEARDAVLEMTTLARRDGVVLRGKTGWHPSEPVGGWFVGSLQSPAGVTTFAVRLTAEGDYDAASFVAARRRVAEELLVELGFAVPR
ncbi:MAG: penicillin-binding transpeptidase domain-containing protein [Polyangiales bacterium]